MLLIERDIFWTFLSVKVFAALDNPTASFPNARLAGSRVTGATPVPVRAIDWGLVEAVSVTVSVAVRLSRADGVNVTVIVQLFPAPRVFGLSAQVPPTQA
jgi:hypothetical protein